MFCYYTVPFVLITSFSSDHKPLKTCSAPRGLSEERTNRVGRGQSGIYPVGFARAVQIEGPAVAELEAVVGNHEALPGQMVMIIVPRHVVAGCCLRARGLELNEEKEKLSQPSINLNCEFSDDYNFKMFNAYILGW